MRVRRDAPIERRLVDVVERQGGGVFDALHREARADVREIDFENEAAVEAVVSSDIGNHHPHQVVDFSAHSIELHNLREFCGSPRKLL